MPSPFLSNGRCERRKKTPGLCTKSKGPTFVEPSPSFEAQTKLIKPVELGRSPTYERTVLFGRSGRSCLDFGHHAFKRLERFLGEAGIEFADLRSLRD